MREACVEVMYILGGMSLDHLGEMTWRELSAWRGLALGTWRRAHGAPDE